MRLVALIVAAVLSALALPAMGRAAAGESAHKPSGGASSHAVQDAKPQRIVSTNLCADQLALALVDRSRIASVSRMAVDPHISNFAEAARGITINNARAEEIIELKPDLLLGDIYTGTRANRLAQMIGAKLHLIGVGTSIGDVRQIIRDAAKALGEEARGAALIAEMDARIARARAIRAPVVTALVYEPNGITSGDGTLSSDVLKLAGLRNVAPDLMSASYGAVPLEVVVMAAPRLIVLDDAYAGSASRAQSILHHPAFRSLEGKTTLVAMPSRLWLCPGPWIAAAVELLARQRGQLARPAIPE